MHTLLFYDYVDNMLEKRAPFRQEHLNLAQSFADNDELLLVGVYPENLDGALLIFNSEESAQEFVNKDPYVINQLVSNWKIRQWSLVLGSRKDSLDSTG